MKTLKILFSFFIFSIALSSCTPQAIEGQQSDINNHYSTGDEGSSPEDGSKD